MARPPSIRDEDILEAAREVFLARGIRATTAEVAQRARVSEGTLFNRFKTKERLFLAALNPDIEDPPEVRGLPERAGHGAVADNLQDACVALIATLRVRIPCSMLSMASLKAEDHARLLSQPPPKPTQAALDAFTRYAAAEIDKKRMRGIDPEVFARTLVGGLMEFVLGEFIFSLEPQKAPPVGRYIRAMLDILLSGALEQPRGARRAD